jgi:hypothetical protein
MPQKEAVSSVLFSLVDQLSVYNLPLTTMSPEEKFIHALCESYSGLVPRRYCKRTLLRVQRLIESRGL